MEVINSFLKSFIEPLGVPIGIVLISVTLNLLMAFLLGGIIAKVYRSTHDGIIQKSFTETLILLCMLIAIVMVVIGNSVARAFSLVGALSIIRFRTAIQDPRDIGFVFFALAVGMAVGAGNPIAAMIATFLISCATIILHNWQAIKPHNGDFRLSFSIPIQPTYQNIYETIFDEYFSKQKLLSRRVRPKRIDLEFSVRFRVPDHWLFFVDKFSSIEGVKKVDLKQR